MHVIGFCGYSGSGKTTLIEQLIARLRLAGQRVSVVKHAHHEFDIDHEGKDSWRHRQAGAFEVVIASNRRLAKIREYPIVAEPTVAAHRRAGRVRLGAGRGIQARASRQDRGLAPRDGKAGAVSARSFVIAIATDGAAALPEPTGLPVFDLDDVDAIARFILDQETRCRYEPLDELDATIATPAQSAG